MTEVRSENREVRNGQADRLRRRSPRFSRLVSHFSLRHALLLSMALLAACGNNMRQQPKYTPLEPSSFFADGQSARPLPPDTVARGQLRTDEQRYTGKVNGTPVAELPYPVTKEILQRGQERFDVYCAVCHGRTGYGDGMIAQRGFPQPPSFHTDRLRDAPVGHFYDVITNGYGVMYSYAARVAPDDRWAIAAYIRALQLSQHASLDDVPPDERQKLETGR
jgi:mono/diheme cytochrome c family protein